MIRRADQILKLLGTNQLKFNKQGAGLAEEQHTILKQTINNKKSIILTLHRLPTLDVEIERKLYEILIENNHHTMDCFQAYTRMNPQITITEGC